MIRFCLFLYIPIFFISCKGPKQPEGILPQDQMQSVIFDLLKVDELITYKLMKDTSYNSSFKHEELYQTILQLHHTTKDQFKKSMNYYQDHPHLLKMMMDSLQKHVDSLPKKTYLDTSFRKRMNVKL